MEALTKLHPAWQSVLRKDSGEGVSFDCPACGPAHQLVAYFANPRDGKPPMPGRSVIWVREGDTFASLTLAPSLQYPCWHGWVEGGQVIDIREATHYTRRLNEQTGRVENVALSPRQVREVAARAKGEGE